jgi:predicted outer membrane repeat protein
MPNIHMLLLLILSSGLFATSARSAVFTVTNDSSAGAGSLHESIKQALLTPLSESAEIVFDPVFFNQSRTIRVTTQFDRINRSLIINGPPLVNGQPSLTLSGDSNADGVADMSGLEFHASSGSNFSWEIRRICFYHFTSTDVGAAIYVESNAPSSLLIEASVFLQNSARGNGGAIYSATSSLTINRCIFEKNQSSNVGGAIWQPNDTSLFCNRCVFRENISSRDGGAIYADSLTAENSWFEGNLATETTATGGAIVVRDTSLFRACTFSKNVANASNGGAVQVRGNSSLLYITTTFHNCTFSENEAGISGGAISMIYANIEMMHCTVVHNIANRQSIFPVPTTIVGGVHVNPGSTCHLINTIIADNEIRLAPNDPEKDLGGTVTNYQSSGGNLIGVGNHLASSFQQPNDIFGSTSSPLVADVGPLQFHGGFTPTRAPYAGSLAINGGEGIPLAIDQRGQSRPAPVEGSSDKGAVEFRILNFNQWAALHLLKAGEDGQMNDPDADGIVNLVEYYTGSDPMRSSASPLRFRIDGTRSEMDFPRADHVATGSFQSIYSTSSDLVQWSRDHEKNPDEVGREGNSIIYRYNDRIRGNRRFMRLDVGPTSTD